MVIYLKKNLQYIEKAKKEKYAIPQFNINNLEWAKYILEVCQEEKSPVFLGVSTGAAKYMGGYNTVVGMVKGLIKDLEITIPVIIHLDHSPSYEECKKAFEAGFDSLMIDASTESIEDNINETNKVSALGDVLVEAELGRIGGVEDDITNKERYTTKEEAEYFCSKTNVDMLAPSLGSVHGVYKSEPNINFELIKEISTSTGVGLVLHGGSGLSKEILQKAISLGVIKININTELQVAWNNSVREFIASDELVYDPRKIISSGSVAIKDAIKEAIKILGCKNKG